MKDKIVIIGAFDFVNLPTGGQPVKTRELYYALCNLHGKENILYIETYGWKKKPVTLIKQIWSYARISKAIIMLPAHNGLQVFARLLTLIKKIFGIKIFYDVIGGWLPDKTSHNNRLKKLLISFDGIWVETTTMKCNLISQGICNVEIVPNFKQLNIIDEDSLKSNNSFPLKVCTFSRVMKEKGIEDAIQMIKRVNDTFGEKTYHLDIYGQIDESFEKEFNELLLNNREYVTYQGVVSPNKSVETLRDYFALLFPTRFFTEGIPGTLIDAYSAGVPVITARWKNSKDVFEDNITGWSFEFENTDDFYSILLKAAEKPDEFNEMKLSSLQAAYKYSPRTVVKKIAELME